MLQIDCAMLFMLNTQQGCNQVTDQKEKDGHTETSGDDPLEPGMRNEHYKETYGPQAIQRGNPECHCLRIPLLPRERAERVA